MIDWLVLYMALTIILVFEYSLVQMFMVRFICWSLISNACTQTASFIVSLNDCFETQRRRDYCFCVLGWAGWGGEALLLRCGKISKPED